MNEKAKQLGLINTHFISPHGLDEEGHYTTAYELALMADYALKNETIAKIVKTKTYTVTIGDRIKTINNTNELLGYLNGVNGVKTGFTNGAGRCLVTSVERENFNIITVVLGADTKKDRTRDSIRLIEYIYSNYELINIKELIEEEYGKWCKINEKRVYIDKGKKSNIKIKLENCKYKLYPIKKEDTSKIRVEIGNKIKFFQAPIYENMQIGTLGTFIGNEKIITLKILTAETIEKKEITDYLIESLTKII